MENDRKQTVEYKMQIETDDDFKIYGTLNSKQRTDTLLIFVHGLSWNQNEHHYINAAPFFTKYGFDTFRFDFYAREKDARPLIESSLTTHKNDLQCIISHFKNSYKNIILIGHSLGSLTILKTDLSNISKIVLWDPSSGFDTIEEKNWKYNKNLEQYILHRGMDIIVWKEMIEERKKCDIKELMKNITIPCEFIFAEKWKKLEIRQSVLNEIAINKSVDIIKKATHCFIEEWTRQELFDKTLKRLKE